MAKKRKRVYEYAKELGLSSSELMHKLKFMGIRVANTFNAIDEETIMQIKQQMGLHLFDDEPEMSPVQLKKKKKEKAAKKKAREKAIAEAERKVREARAAVKAEMEAEEKNKKALNKTAGPERVEDKRLIGRPVVIKRADQLKAAPITRKPIRKAAPEAAAPVKKAPVGKKKPQADKGKPVRESAGADADAGAKPAKDDGKRKRVPKKKKPERRDSGTRGPSSKRLDAIKKNRFHQARKGTKTTFFKRRTKKGKKRTPEEKAAEKAAVEHAALKRLTISGPQTVKELSHNMGIKPSEIIMYLMKELSLMATLNQSLGPDVLVMVAEYFDCVVVKDGKEMEASTVEEDAENREEIEAVMPTLDDEDTEIRAPIVTVMGHVDHGKTRLLDTIRKTSVIDTEAGGITQHIGAYQVEHNGRRIAFLDTPGHAAFTKLRARGASVTDLAVLVVAADDGVMPQTIEAIEHARAANVAIIVAVNKIDKPQAAPDRVRQQLSDKGLIPEEWGGDTVFVDISAKMNTNIDDLLEMIFLVTDILELKANPTRPAVGTIIEAKLDKGKGPVATVLVQNGTLHVGDNVVVGESFGKVRAMANDVGKTQPEAGPSTPVEITGLSSVPEAGDQLIVLEDEKIAKEIAAKRLARSREKKLKYESRVTLEALFDKIKDDKINEFKIVLKGDVQGSLEAITHSLEDITHDKVRVNVIRAGVGDINVNDVMLAAASDAILMGYGVGIILDAKLTAQNEGVEVRHYRIIYNLTDDVRKAMAGMLEPEFERVLTGKAEVRKIFESSKFGKIAGSYITEGEAISNGLVRVFREGNEVYEGKITSLKRFKDNVKTVRHGMECGITLDGYGEIAEDDILEIYKMVELEQEIL